MLFAEKVALKEHALGIALFHFNDVYSLQTPSFNYYYTLFSSVFQSLNVCLCYINDSIFYILLYLLLKKFDFQIGYELLVANS